MSKINYHDGVSVETEVKENTDFDSLNEKFFQFFGLSEKGIQTELTMRDINEMDNNKDIDKKELEKNISDFNFFHKIDPLFSHELPFNKKEEKYKLNEPKIQNLNNKNNLLGKISNKFIEPNNENNKNNAKNTNNTSINYSNYKINLSKNNFNDKKKNKKDEKKDNFLDKKRKRENEEKISSSNNNKLKNKEIVKPKEKIKIKEKEKEKEKENDKSKLKEKNKKIKNREDDKEKNINVSEKKDSKKEKKESKKEKNIKKNDKNEQQDINKNISDIQNLVSQLIDDSVSKSNSRRKYPKVDAYTIFKKEFKQYKDGKNEDKSEKEIQNEWNKVSKDLRKVYNINAGKENKLIKEYIINKLKLHKNKKGDTEKIEGNKKEKKERKDENE